MNLSIKFPPQPQMTFGTSQITMIQRQFILKKIQIQRLLDEQSRLEGQLNQLECKIEERELEYLSNSWIQEDGTDGYEESPQHITKRQKVFTQQRLQQAQSRTPQSISQKIGGKSERTTKEEEMQERKEGQNQQTQKAYTQKEVIYASNHHQIDNMSYLIQMKPYLQTVLITFIKCSSINMSKIPHKMCKTHCNFHSLLTSITIPLPFLYKTQMFGLSEGYQQLWKAIIRPPRSQYTLEMLGPKVFKTKGLKIQRTDIQLLNKQKLKLQCSYYQPFIRPARVMPCVIYLHGNSSSRLEGSRIVHYLIARNITVFTLDFAGCGLSEGEYISLGFYERGDVDCVFQYLRGLGTVSSIGIWGRSMGAATALMYSDTNHEIGCLVLDSPFANLERLSKELAEKHGGGLSIFSGIALSLIKSTIKDKHHFNIEELDPIGHVKNAFIPAFFIHGKQDDFILPKHTQDLHSAYSGEKRIKIVSGGHNDSRPDDVIEQIATFFYYGLCVADLVQEDKEYMEQQKNQKVKPSQKPKKRHEQQLHQYEFHDFGLSNEEDLQQKLLKQAIALSLQESKKAESKEKQQEK